MPGRFVRNSYQFGSGLSLKEGQVFRPAQQVATTLTLKAGVGVCLSGGFLRCASPVSLWIPQYFTLSVCGAIGCFAGNFGLTVTVQVINHKLGIMCSFADILTQIDSPQELSVQAVSLEFGLSGKAVVGVVPGPHLLLDDNLVLAVSVQITCGTIARNMPGQRL